MFQCKFLQRQQIAHALRARAILLVFEKIYSCLFIPNCTRNHVITYTNICHLPVAPHNALLSLICYFIRQQTLTLVRLRFFTDGLRW